MDDNTFDDHIRGELEHYEDPAFDSAAFDGFRQMMSGLRPVPWYKQYAPHLVAATLLLLTLSNGYMLWSIANRPESDLTASNNSSVNANNLTASEYNSKQAVIDSLANVITQMQCDHQSNLVKATDQHLQEKAQLRQHYALAIAKLSDDQERKSEINDSETSLGLVSDMPLAIYKALQEKGLLVTKNGEAYLSSTIRKEYYPHQDSTQEQLLLSRSGPGGDLVLPRYILISPQIATAKNTASKKEHKEKFSLKAKNELEKHYFGGIGINVAPHLDLMQNIFSPGDGHITPRVGFMADWVLSPRWSVETGLDYSFVAVDFNKKESANLYKNGISQLGYLQSSSLGCKLVSTPINIKYRRWISENNQLILRSGFTPYFSFSNEYRYNYILKPADGDNPGYDHLNVTAVNEVNKSYYYGGTWSVSAGVTSRLQTKKPNKRPRTVEASIFYEKNVNTVGRENYQFQLLGLRTAIWLNLK